MATQNGNVPDNNTRGVSHRRPKAKIFLLTINPESLKHYDDIKSYFDNLKSCNYYIVTEHHGQKQQHYHLAAQFGNAMALSVKKLYGAHIKAGKYGSIQDMVHYCKCEDEKHKKAGVTATIIDEVGEMKIGNRFPTIKEVKQMSKEDRDELPLQYKNAIDRINNEEANDIDIDDLGKTVKVYFICGPSGVGKTSKAKEIFRENKQKYPKMNRVKFTNGFWAGVGTAKACLYDDFRDSHMPASEFINFIDYNKQIMNIKGGNKTNEYELIVITSTQRPSEIYKNMKDEPRKQWMRRMEIIDMYPEESFVDDDLDICIDDM